MSSQLKRVLVAEDNHVLSDVLCFNLRRADLDVTAARDGGEAIEHLERQSFDLLITDYQMPGTDGAKLCHHVREVLKLRDMPIVMCSAKGLELAADQLKQQWNVTKVIHKPFSMREIVALAKTLVADHAVA